MPDLDIVVQRAYMPTVNIPERLQAADVVEIRITLTPMRWSDTHGDLARSGEQVNGAAHITKLQARDHRAVFHATRQMLDDMLRHYMNIEVKP